ncbi:hypothetical protein [Flavobacterium sp.]|uniref:hypothetical protein n=1 Tax=Flavobacterium sp. TaxID=239 RepID=UPI0038FC765D
MKKVKLALFIATSIFGMTFISCQKSEVEEANAQSIQKQQTSRSVAACPATYALVLSGGFGTPVPAGLTSYIYRVNLCSTPVGYNFVSAIKIGATPVTGVTGICDMPGVVDFAWAVTGVNSNFPKRLLKVQISTGNASIVAVTSVYLQDIENFGTTGLFVAIQEGTSQLMKVNVISGASTAFAPVGIVPQYNGLTVVGNNFQAISGTTNAVCPPTTGDIFEYLSTGGNYIAKYSYKNLTANATWTMKELGFHFDSCCGRRWVVGSSSNIISNNTNIAPCVLPNPTFLLNTSLTGQNFFAIYDFMAKP